MAHKSWSLGNWLTAANPAGFYRGQHRKESGLASLSDGSGPFAAAVRVTKMPMMITGPCRDDNPILFANDAFCRQTGYSREEVLGRNCRFLQGPESDPVMIDRIRMALTAAEPTEIELRNYRKDGSMFWNRLLIAPVLGPTGDVAYFFASQLDITFEREALATRTRELEKAGERLRIEAADRERVEEALRQSHKMEAIGQLTGGIAHDFNNMLQAISGCLDLAGRRIERGDTADATRLMESAQRSVAHAAGLTHRLLAFARRQVLQPEAVVINLLVDGMADLFKRTVGAAIEVELGLGDGCSMVLCDPNQLESALLNLVINARDAMPGGGRLTIATCDLELQDVDVPGHDGAVSGRYVEVHVRDTGVGMDDATKGLAFDPFFTTKPLGEGTGLGLSQIYGFVRQSNGIVVIDSALGQGTTVRMQFPRHVVAAASQDRVRVQADEEWRGKGEIVLLVEDEETVRTLAAAELRDLGFTVLEAADGASAMLLLRMEARVDVLVTDVGLSHGLNGRQLADAARETRPDLPVLFITGYAGSVLQRELPPNMDVIGKPFTLGVFARRVQAMIGLARRQSNLAAEV